MQRSATFVDVAARPRAPVRGRRERLAETCARWRLLPLMRRLRSVFRHDLRILAYHRIAPRIDEDGFDFDVELLSASADAFRAQMRHLRDAYTPMRFADVLAAHDARRPVPRDAVVVTFDDGYDDNHDVALPILRELGVPATFFVSTGHIDRGHTYAFDWVAHALLLAPPGRLAVPALGLDETLGTVRSARRALVARTLDRIKSLTGNRQEDVIGELLAACGQPASGAAPASRPMCWDQVRALQAAGMEIGSHGTHHRMLAKLDEDGIRAELRESRDAIARELGAPPQVLAYPVGGTDAYDARVVRIARELGYRLGCSYLPGINFASIADWFALRRIAVERNTGSGLFEARLAAPEIFGDRQRAPRGSA
jgi:peptidoglycan/xylan/chitin deacetylase (PgdA/CDA1 family)